MNIRDKKRVQVGAFTLAWIYVELCTDATGYRDVEKRPGYVHSIGVTEHWVLIPITSYLIDFCTDDSLSLFS